MPSHFTHAQSEQFLREGLVRIDHAFPPEIATEARAILWRDTGCDPEDRSTWTRPVIRLGDYAQEPFRIGIARLFECIFPILLAGERATVNTAGTKCGHEPS